jgi:hypothetical protein
MKLADEWRDFYANFFKELSWDVVGPVALLGFRCWRRFCAPSVLMVILFISGVELIPSSGRLSTWIPKKTFY